MHCEPRVNLLMEEGRSIQRLDSVGRVDIFEFVSQRFDRDDSVVE
jgi:hypothetical protein